MARRYRWEHYAHLITASVLVLLCLFGCAAPTDADTYTEEAPEMTDKSRWGQTRPIGPNWVEDVPYVLFQNDTQENPTTIIEPETLNLILGFTPQTTPTGTAIFRWQIQSGVGGGSRVWLIDARPLQQVSLSAGFLKVSMLAERWYTDGGTMQNPNVVLDAAALSSLGATNTPQATYTMWRANLTNGILPADAWEISTDAAHSHVPAGATGFRLVGDTFGSNSPFIAKLFVSLQGGVFSQGAFQGDQLLPLALGGDFIPLPGGFDKMRVTIDPTGPALIQNVGIQWAIDL